MSLKSPKKSLESSDLKVLIYQRIHTPSLRNLPKNQDFKYSTNMLFSCTQVHVEQFYNDFNVKKSQKSLKNFALKLP